MENTIGVKKILYKVATYADRLKNISSSCRRKPGSILDYSGNSPIRELIILKEGAIEVVVHIATDITDAFGRNLTMICSQNSSPDQNSSPGQNSSTDQDWICDNVADGARTKGWDEALDGIYKTIPVGAWVEGRILWEVIKGKDAKTFKKIIDRIPIDRLVSIKRHNKTILQACTINGFVEGIQMLVQKGASLSKNSHQLHQKNSAFSKEKETPLLTVALQKRDLPLIKTLISLGGYNQDIFNAHSNFWCFLLYSFFGNIHKKKDLERTKGFECVNYCLDAGIPPCVNYEDAFAARNAFTYAISLENVPLLELFLQNQFPEYQFNDNYKKNSTLEFKENHNTNITATTNHDTKVTMTTNYIKPFTLAKAPNKGGFNKLDLVDKSCNEFGEGVVKYKKFIPKDKNEWQLFLLKLLLQNESTAFYHQKVREENIKMLKLITCFSTSSGILFANIPHETIFRKKSFALGQQESLFLNLISPYTSLFHTRMNYEQGFSRKVYSAIKNHFLPIGGDAYIVYLGTVFLPFFCNSTHMGYYAKQTSRTLPEILADYGELAQKIQELIGKNTQENVGANYYKTQNNIPLINI